MCLFESMSISKQYVIYTAVVGEYDNIIQPKITDSRFDYILFSDTMHEDKCGVWTVRNIDFYDNDKTTIARYVKTHSHVLLSDYSLSVWVDANVVIESSYLYEKVICLYNDGVNIASMHHLWRNTILDEAFTIMRGNLDSERNVINLLKYLMKNGYPLKLGGLYETNVLYRANISIMERFNSYWWYCIDSYSRRDQLSFNYVMWKYGFKFEYILPEGYNVRNSDDFTCIEHKKDRYLRYSNKLYFLRYGSEFYDADTLQNVFVKCLSNRYFLFMYYMSGYVYCVRYILSKIRNKLKMSLL